MLESATSVQDIVEKHGPWTAMCIGLGDGQYTLTPARADSRLRRLVQIVADLSRKPLNQLRVLDLACLEGHYGIEFARQGSRVVGIEIREANLAKANFAKHRLGLGNIDFVQDDVRNLSKSRYGTFDVAICSGILYHLTTPDVFEFAGKIFEVCDHLAIIDTHFALYDKQTVEHRGKRYSGLYYREHSENATAQEKYEDLWASLENTSSFWLTHASLCNLMAHVGFSSLYECHNPSGADQHDDRKTYVAIKSSRAAILTSPQTDGMVDTDWPEHHPRRVAPVHLLTEQPVRRFFKSALPQPLKNVIKPVLRALRLLEPDGTPAWRRKQLKAAERG